jgi:hypothetical protein
MTQTVSQPAVYAKGLKATSRFFFCWTTCVCVCFVSILEQTTTYATYNINWFL